MLEFVGIVKINLVTDISGGTLSITVHPPFPNDITLQLWIGPAQPIANVTNATNQSLLDVSPEVT